MQYSNLLKQIPSLTVKQTKGDNGIILIIGGSELYTGAPYFAAMAALRTGVDLVYILSYNPMPLKPLLPECIIGPIRYEPWILDRCNVCIFGCGLGIPSDLIVLNQIITYILERKVLLVIDGDGINYYIQNYDLFLVYASIILTPNKRERKRLDIKGSSHYILSKGEKDNITYKDINFKVNSMICPKRCGGQGDILAGILGAYLCWVPNKTEYILSCMEYSSITLRKAAFIAYQKNKRGLIASDIIKEITKVVE